jgi:hypothetical protein
MFWRTLFLSCIFFSAFPVASAQEDALLVKSQSYTEKNRPFEAINLLEDALLKDPKQEAYWVELLRNMNHPELRYAFPYYHQEASKHFPKSRGIQWEYVRSVSPAVGLDVLDLLEPLEPNKELLNDAREVLSLGNQLYDNWRTSAPFHGAWAMGLVKAQKIDRAAIIIKRGLAIKENEPMLRQSEAFMLAVEGKFDEALRANERAGYRQIMMHKGVRGFPTLGDLLLAQKRYKDVIASYGPKRENRKNLGAEGLVLGQALLLDGQVDEAEAVFESTDRNISTMLMIAMMLDKKLEAEARVIAEEMLNKWEEPRYPKRRTNTDMRYRCNWPTSLEASLKRSLKWLWEQHPKDQKMIEYYLATPETLFSIPTDLELTVPASKQIPELLKSIPTAENKAKPTMYVQQFYFESGRLDQSAQVMVEDLKRKHQQGTFSFIEMEYWSKRRREMESMAYYRTHFEELIKTRRLLANLTSRFTFRSGPIEYQEWLSDENAVNELTKQGPACLPFIYQHCIATPDGKKNHFLKIMAQIGGRTEVPFLTVQYRYHYDRLGEARARNAEEEERKHLPYVNELIVTLDKLGGKKTPEGSLGSQVNHWLYWWNDQFEDLIKEADEQLKVIQKNG